MSLTACEHVATLCSVDEFQAVDPSRVLADLKAFWDDPKPGILGNIPHGKIAESKYDQIVPVGTDNPYWQIVRLIPFDDLFGLELRLRPRPADFIFTRDAEDRLDFITTRDELCRTFAWGIPSPGDIAWIRDVLEGRGIVECGAGGGYWTWQLRQSGVDVVAYEPHDSAKNCMALRQWSLLRQGNHKAAILHPDRALFLCWPSNKDPWAAKALAAYQGDLVIYCGADFCCADEKFFKILDDRWDEISSSPAHVSYSTISYERLTAYRRRKSGRM